MVKCNCQHEAVCLHRTEISKAIEPILLGAIRGSVAEQAEQYLKSNEFIQTICRFRLPIPAIITMLQPLPISIPNFVRLPKPKSGSVPFDENNYPAIINYLAKYSKTLNDYFKIKGGSPEKYAQANFFIQTCIIQNCKVKPSITITKDDITIATSRNNFLWLWPHSKKKSEMFSFAIKIRDDSRDEFVMDSRSGKNSLCIEPYKNYGNVARIKISIFEKDLKNTNSLDFLKHLILSSQNL